MSLLEKIQQIALPLEASEFYRNLIIYLVAISAAMGGIMYYHHSKTSELRTSLQKMYKNQQEAKIILERLKVVQKQSDEVNSLLEEDKNFKLKNYFDEIVQKAGLSKLQAKEAEVSEEILQKLYTEIKINAQFNGMTTKQMCELLQAIEQKQRVYIKELSITQKNNALIIAITVATLKSHVSKKE